MMHRGFGLGDWHCPHESGWAFEAICRWALEHEWDSWFQCGDSVDFARLGRFELTGGETNPFDEITRARQRFEQVHDAAARRRPDCKLIYTPGNHEVRWNKAVFASPQWQGFFPHLYEALGVRQLGAAIAEPYAHGEVSSVLRLEKQGDPGEPGPVELVLRRLGDRARRHGLTFLHGQYHSRNASRSHAERIGAGPVLHGHTHSLMRIAADSWFATDSVGYAIGWLGEGREGYQTTPDSWENGFCEYVWDGLNWHISLIPIFLDERSARFWYGGKMFEAGAKLISTPRLSNTKTRRKKK